jgi:beta-exotoxin I transport system permease protein
MPAELARLDVVLRRRSLFGYTAGMALYTLVIVALYPSFKDSTSLDKLVTNDATLSALFGITGSLSSPAGWLSGNIYANFMPLVMLLLTIGYGASSLAGQNEDGTLCLLAVLPVRRTTIVLQKAAAMVFQAVLLAAVVAAFVFVGRLFDVDLAAGRVVGISATSVLVGLDFGLVTLAVGARTGRRGTALGVGTSLASASYLVGSLAPVVSWLHPARYASLFYWSVGNEQISRGADAGSYVVLIAVALVAVWAAAAAFGRLDVRSRIGAATARAASSPSRAPPRPARPQPSTATRV